MLISRAINIIRTFSPEELKQFSAFTRSPYHNTNRNLVKLFDLIRLNFKRLDSETVTEETTFEKLFPGKKYNYNIMKNLMSALFKLTEDFLSIHPPEGDSINEFETGLKRLRNYSVRSLEKLFHAEYKQLDKEMEYSVLSTDFYRNKHRLTEALYKFYTRKSKYTGASETLYPMSIYNTCNIIATVKHDIAGMEYLESQVNYHPQVNVTEAFYRNFDFENFLKDIKGLDTEHYDYIHLQIRLMKLYKETENFENYYELKEFIFRSIDKYSNSEKWFLSSALFGFVLNNYIKASSKELLMELAAIRKTQLEHVKFNSGGLGPLQSGVFRNIIEIFVLLGDIDFVKYVIEKYINELEENKRKSSYSYSMALIEETRGNNEEVLRLIRDVEFTDYQAKFSVKMVALVAFYNLGYIEEGLSAADSLKHFIKDNEEFSEAAKENLSRRVFMLEKLFKIKANPEKYSLADVEQLESSAGTYIAARKEWFLNKTADLKKLVASLIG